MNINFDHFTQAFHQIDTAASQGVTIKLEMESNGVIVRATAEGDDRTPKKESVKKVTWNDLDQDQVRPDFNALSDTIEWTLRAFV
jgi:hypothetical protein